MRIELSFLSDVMKTYLGKFLVLRIWRPTLSSLSVILLVRDLFHPVNNFSVERFLNSGMCHRDSRASAMPVLLIRFEPDHITWSDFFNRASPFLNPAGARRDDERLTEGMGMPHRARSGLKRHARAAPARRIGGLEQRIDPHRSREILRRFFRRAVCRFS